jgi:hypothetical protein
LAMPKCSSGSPADRPPSRAEQKHFPLAETASLPLAETTSENGDFHWRKPHRFPLAETTSTI